MLRAPRSTCEIALLTALGLVNLASCSACTSCHGVPASCDGRPSRDRSATALKATWKKLVWAALAFLNCASAAEAPRAQPELASTPAHVVEDPLGRTTPLGTVAGFTSAVRRENFTAAEQYLQLTPAQRPAAESLARELTALIDRYFTQPITALSSAPEGRRDDGLPSDRDQVVLAIDGRTLDLDLVRVNDAQSGPIWLISSSTLAAVPSLRSSIDAGRIQSLLPAAFATRSLSGISLAQWTMWGVSIAAPLVLLWLVSRLVSRVARRRIENRAHHSLLDSWQAGLAWPLILTGTLTVHLALMPLLGFPISFRLVHLRCALAVGAVVLAWLLWRLVSLSARQAELVAQRSAHAGTRSLMLLGEQVLKVLIVVLAIVSVLTIAGVHTTTALAGLGIGGIAVALGAQKSVENLLGGVFLLTDKAIAVGDMCRVSDRTGWIEDITLRSVRLRTVEQTLLSIPAGVLAQASIENFATRNKMPVQSTLHLRYGTSTDQLKTVLKEIRALLEADQQLEAAGARIRLVNFGPEAMELELFANVMTSDRTQFLAARETLLLRISEIVERSGTGFAHS